MSNDRTPFQKVDVKDNILNIATHIFGKIGFKQTTVDEIAKAAQKGKSTIYHYFKSKEDIFRAVVEKEAQTLRTKLVSVVSEDLPPEEKLKKYILTRLVEFKSMINFYRAVKDDYLSHLSFIEDIRKKYDKEEVMLFKMILMEGESQGVFDINDINLAAEATSVVLKGLEYPMLFGNEAMEKVDGKLDEVLNMIFHGILKRP